ncbi:MAG: hypothetical protein Q8R02_11025 [Hyphomonadaceae bacterium]|nr:hypothetical protein [Hyphomonadaceae bacterium]
MRTVIVVVLAIVAVGFAGVWALGQFGGALTSEATVVAVPMVKEPEPIVTAAAAPVVEPPVSRAARTVAPPVVEPAPEPVAPATAAPAATPAPETPAATAPAASPTPNPLRPNTLDASPASPVVPPPAAADPTVAPQSAPATAPAAPPEPAAKTSARESIATPQSSPAAGPASAAATSLESQFKSRRLTYNRPPEKLALNKPIDISLIIDSTGQNNAAERLKDLPGTIVERDVDLSDFVAAELNGADFDIQLQTTAPRQKLSPRIANEWRWRVTPTATGTHTLTLTVYGYETGSLDGEPLDSYRDDIVVEVQQLDQVINWAKGVQPVFAVMAALAGAASALFGFLRFREEKKRNT